MRDFKNHCLIISLLLIVPITLVNADNFVSVIDTSTNTVAEPSIPVGGFPFGIAIASTVNGVYAYVTNSDDNTVSVIDTSTNTVVGSIPVGSNPIGIVIGSTVNGLYAYVTNYAGSSGNVSIIDTSTNTTIVGSPLTVGGNASGIAITPNGDFVYVVCSASQNVYVIDTSSNMVVGSPISISSMSTNPYAIAIASTINGVYAYATNTDVFVIDTSTNMLVGSPIVVGNQPSGIAVGSTVNGVYAYVLNTDDATVSVIDTSMNTVVGSPISLTGSGGFSTFGGNIAISPNGDFVYVAGTNTGFIIDTSTNTLVKSPLTFGSDNARGVAIIPNNRLAYVTNTNNLIPSSIKPPKNLTGSQKKNSFGLTYELYNVLEWQASPSSTVIGYNIYRNGSKIASVDASTLTYQDHNREKKVTTDYRITSFDQEGNESTSINIAIQ